MYHTNEKNPADQVLVDKVLGGDTNAFRLIMKNTEGLIAQIVFKMIPGIEDRKDIAQDIYIKAFQKLGSFRFQSKLSTWIGQIAYNTCLNYLEKKKLVLVEKIKEDNLYGDEDIEVLPDNNDPYANETGTHLIKKELSEILKTETDKLSPLHKILITLYHNEGLSYAEMAEITGLPAGTVKNYLFRARKALRDNLLLTYKKESL